MDNIAPFSAIGSLILAAGGSRRMGRVKALLPLPDGPSFLQTILRRHARLGGPRVVVVGADSERIRAACREHVSWVVNEHPERGPLSSLLLGLKRLGGCRAVIVHPVDHPLVESNTLLGLAEAHWRLPACILIPEWRGAKGHPVLFPARFYPDLRDAPLNVGARSVVRAHSDAVHRVRVADPGICRNIDTPADYESLFIGSRRNPPGRGAE